MLFLTCADNTSNWGGVASSVSKWSLWALSQCWLHSIAFNLIDPGLSCAVAIVSYGGNRVSPPAVQLSAHHICIIHIPGFTTHIPPLAFVVELDSSNTTTVAIGQLHIAWKLQLLYEWIVHAVQAPCLVLIFKSYLNIGQMPLQRDHGRSWHILSVSTPWESSLYRHNWPYTL